MSDESALPIAATESMEEDGHFLDHVAYRSVTPTDLIQILALEKGSYPPELAASKNELQYRQHHAASFFRCAVIEHEDSDEADILGYVTGTRCQPANDDTVPSKSHVPTHPTLVIHSVVVKEEYRQFGLGANMVKDYLRAMKEFNATSQNPLSEVIIYTTEKQLSFFIVGGFTVVRPSRSFTTENRVFYLQHELQYFGTIARRDPTRAMKSSGKECYIVDSFAAGPGTGNPAAVVLLSDEPSSESNRKWMQTVAAEFNLAETAFCWPKSMDETSSKHNNAHWGIRYFTPKVEIPLCGHATLAAAAVLYQTLKQSVDSGIVFHANEDELSMDFTERQIDDDGALRTRVSMDFPTKPPKEIETRENQSAVRIMLESAFCCQLEPLYVGISDIGDVLVELSPEAFLEIGYEKINFKALFEWDGYYRGVIICCVNPQAEDNSKSDSDGEQQSPESQPDFLSRFFGPKAGINEDPVTGSAHCVLGPYFSKKLDKTTLIGKQMSERGGEVECQVSSESVRLTGTATTTMSGMLWM